MKIGIFDSGMGGLSVLHQAMHKLPEEEYVFYADTDHVPYGLKTKEQILLFSEEITKFLIEENVDCVLIACNTASACAASVLREEYRLPIIAMEPAVKPALHTGKNRILVTATPVTLREEKLKNLIAREGGADRIDLLPLPELVTFAEREEFSSDAVLSYLREALRGHEVAEYSAAVLGCTHFNYFKPAFREILGGDVCLIDGNEGTIRHTAEVLGLETVQDSGVKISFCDVSDMQSRFSVSYYYSGREITDRESLSHIMRMHNRLEECLGY